MFTPGNSAQMPMKNQQLPSTEPVFKAMHIAMDILQFKGNCRPAKFQFHRLNS